MTQTAAATLVVASSGGGTSGGGLTACDVNKDGTANVVDVQVATNNYLSCSTTPFQSFVSQVIGGVLGACSTSTGYHTIALSWGASTYQRCHVQCLSCGYIRWIQLCRPAELSSNIRNILYGLHDRAWSNVLLRDQSDG